MIKVKTQVNRKVKTRKEKTFILLYEYSIYLQKLEEQKLKH